MRSADWYGRALTGRGKDQKVNDAVMKVMLQMKKLDIAALKKAYKEAEAVPAGRR
jgi:hypothetical protein